MELARTPNGLPGSQGNETAAPPSGEPPSAGTAPRTTAVRAPRAAFVRGLPFIGNVWEMGTDPGAFFVKCYREAGPIFRIRLFNKPYTVLAGPEANRFIAREGDTHLRSKEFWQEFVDEFGAKKNLVNTDGEMHDKIRKVLKRGYGRASISGGYQEIIDITDRILQDEWQPGQRLRVVPAMQRLAAEQLGIMVAGRAPGESVDDLRVFIRYALNVLVVHMRPRIMLRMPDYRRAKKRIFELGQRMIDSYDPGRVDPKQPTLIDDIMAAAKQDETLFEGGELMMAVLGPYFAGLDTVANTTSAMLYAVLKHRDVHEQVLAEVDRVFAAGPVTPESLRTMPVFHGACIRSRWPPCAMPPATSSSPVTWWKRTSRSSLPSRCPTFSSSSIRFRPSSTSRASRRHETSTSKPAPSPHSVSVTIPASVWASQKCRSRSRWRRCFTGCRWSSLHPTIRCA
jgi:cytochrome P450